MYVYVCLQDYSSNIILGTRLTDSNAKYQSSRGEVFKKNIVMKYYIIRMKLNFIPFCNNFNLTKIPIQTQLQLITSRTIKVFNSTLVLSECV